MVFNGKALTEEHDNVLISTFNYKLQGGRTLKGSFWKGEALEETTDCILVDFS